MIFYEVSHYQFLFSKFYKYRNWKGEGEFYPWGCVLENEQGQTGGGGGGGGGGGCQNPDILTKRTFWMSPIEMNLGALQDLQVLTQLEVVN